MPPKKDIDESEFDSDASTYSDEESAYKKRILKKTAGPSKSDLLKEKRKKQEQFDRALEKELPSRIAPIHQPAGVQLIPSTIPKILLNQSPNLPHILSSFSHLSELPNALLDPRTANLPVVFQCVKTKKYILLPTLFVKDYYQQLDLQYSNLRSELLHEYPMPTPISSPPQISVDKLVQNLDGTVARQVVLEPHPTFINFGQSDFDEWNNQQLRIYNQMLNSIQLQREFDIQRKYYYIDSTTLPFDVLSSSTLFSPIAVFQSLSQQYQISIDQLKQQYLSTPLPHHPLPNTNLIHETAWRKVDQPINIVDSYYNESDIEDGVLVSNSIIPGQSPYSFPQLNLNPFTIEQYYQIYCHPDWTIYETIALLQFVVLHQADSFLLTKSNPILSARHSWEQCLDRWLSICAIASSSNQLLSQQVFNNTSGLQQIDSIGLQLCLDQQPSTDSTTNESIPAPLHKQNYFTLCNALDSKGQWIDQGWDVPVILPPEFEPDQLNQCCHITTISQQLQSPRQLLPSTSFFDSTHYTKDPCFGDGRDRFGIALNEVPIPTDLMSQLSSQSVDQKAGIVNHIELGRSFYSLAYNQMLDHGEFALRSNGYLTTLPNGFCPPLDPTNENLQLSTRASNLSLENSSNSNPKDSNRFSNRSSSNGNNISKQFSSKSRREDRNSGDDEYVADSSSDEYDDGDDDNDDDDDDDGIDNNSDSFNNQIKTRTQRGSKYMPSRRSRRSTRYDEASHDINDFQPRLRATKSKNVKMDDDDKMDSSHDDDSNDDHNDGVNDDGDDNDNDDDHDDDDDDGDDDDNSDGDVGSSSKRPGMGGYLTQFKIEKLLSSKQTKKRLTFRLDGITLTPTLIDATFEAHQAEEALRVAAGEPLIDVLTQEQQEELSYNAYEQMLREIVSEDFEDYDDFSINGLHPEFADEFGYFDDSEIEPESGKKYKDLATENQQRVHEEQSAQDAAVEIATSSTTTPTAPTTTTTPIAITSQQELSTMIPPTIGTTQLLIAPTTVTTTSTTIPLSATIPASTTALISSTAPTEAHIDPNIPILSFLAPYLPHKQPIPSDAIALDVWVDTYLIKEVGKSYKHSRWYSMKQMISRFGPKSSLDRIKRFKIKKEEIENENLDKYGGLPFDPRFNEVDRIVSFSHKIYSAANLVTELPSGFQDFNQLEAQIIPKFSSYRFIIPDPTRPDYDSVELVKTMSQEEYLLYKATKNSNVLSDVCEPQDYDQLAIPCYLVKWQGLGYGISTWEPKALLQDEELHIAQYNRFSKRPTAQQLQPRVYTQEQALKRSARINQWYDESPQFKGGNTLRPYQVQGINWLIKCYLTNKNAILADEMGLGKTVQCITFLEHLRREEGVRGPFLVVAPLSTLSNWVSECETWTDMNCLFYHDSSMGHAGRALLRQYEFYYPKTNIPKFNVLITSYEMLLTDVEELKKCQFRYVIIDEGHRLKNKTAKLMDAFTYLDIHRRLLLTGTPIQNNTTELWTLLNFLEPTKFNDEKSFKAKFGTVAGSAQAELLQQTINPYMLRRMKETVEKAIPRKVEHIVNVELTRTQKLYYRAVYERNITFLKNGSNAQNAPKLINIETELRKVCNHPWLVIGAEAKQEREELQRLASSQTTTTTTTTLSPEQRLDLMIAASGKLGFLEKLLPKLKQQGERVLIFSQMVSMLDLLSDYLTQRGHKHERLDGSINGDQRVAAIERFTKPDSDRFAFLLSTRAGGVGLNLTCANIVIIFDSDWNPQQDIQAQARAHRIGQKSDVRIYRLVTRGTYESEMFARASKKLGLDHAILKKLEVNEKGQSTMVNKRGRGGINSERQDIENVLKYGAYGILENDDDEDRKRFFEADIDTILAMNTYTVNNEKTNQQNNTEELEFDGGLADQQRLHQKQLSKARGSNNTTTPQNDVSSMGISHQKLFFAADKDAVDLDIKDDNFWTKILSVGSIDYKYTKDALLSRLTVKKGSAQSLTTQQDKESYFADLQEGYNRVLNARMAGELEIHDVDDFISLLDMVIDRTTTFTEIQRNQASDWIAELERLTTRRTTTATTSTYRYDDSSDYDEDDDEDDENGGSIVANNNDHTNDTKNELSNKRFASMSEKSKAKNGSFLKRRANNNDSSDYEDPFAKSKASKPTPNKPGARDLTESEARFLGLSIEEELVLKEMGGVHKTVHITIPRRGKGARPLQQNFVCSVCYCPGDLIACDGLCCRLFHRECVPMGAPKLGTLPNDIQISKFIPPDPCYVFDASLVPLTIEEANIALINEGKAPLPNDGKDYIVGLPGSDKLYLPPKDLNVLATTHWECAECLSQLWRCCYCQYPVQCIETTKLGLDSDRIQRKSKYSTHRTSNDDNHDYEDEDDDDNDNDGDGISEQINTNSNHQLNPVRSTSKDIDVTVSRADILAHHSSINVISPLTSTSHQQSILPHGGKFCHQPLCGRIAHIACIQQNECHIARENASGNSNNNSRVKTFRCSHHACEICYSTGVDFDNSKRRPTNNKSINASNLPILQAPFSSSSNSNSNEEDTGLSTFIEVITPSIHNTNNTHFSPSNATETFHNLPTEGATTTVAITIHDDGSQTKITTINDRTSSRQKALASNQVFPCVSCNTAIHLKCFPKDASSFARPSKRQILCTKCTSIAIRTDFGQRVLQLSEWTYSINLLKDRIKIPMHHGPKRGEAPSEKSSGNTKSSKSSPSNISGPCEDGEQYDDMNLTKSKATKRKQALKETGSSDEDNKSSNKSNKNKRSRHPDSDSD